MKVFSTDYDGVIINIESQKATVFGDLLNKEWGINKAEAARLWMKTGGTPRRYKFEYYYEKQFGKKLTENDYGIIEKKFSNLLKNEFYPQLELLPGALDLLKFVKKNFDYSFVSSGIPMEEIKYLVSLNGLSDYFDSILGTNDVYPTKREHFQKIIEEQQPNLIVFIADGIEDMKVAKEYKLVKSIGVTTNHSRKELTNANYIVDSLSEVSPLINSLI